MTGTRKNRRVAGLWRVVVLALALLAVRVASGQTNPAGTVVILPDTEVYSQKRPA